MSPAPKEPLAKPEKGPEKAKQSRVRTTEAEKRGTATEAKSTKSKRTAQAAETKQSEAKQSVSTATPPVAKVAEHTTTSEAPQIWGLSWADRMRATLPEEEKESPKTNPPVPAVQPQPMEQPHPGPKIIPPREFKVKEARQPRQKKEAAQQKEAVQGKAPGWSWNFDEEIEMTNNVSQAPQKAPGWTWDLGEGIEMEPRAPGWSWKDVDGDDDIVMEPLHAPAGHNRWNQERADDRLKLGIVANWGAQGFGFIADATGTRWYAKQEAVRGATRLRIGNFVWFKLGRDVDKKLRVLQVDPLDEGTFSFVQKQLRNGTPWHLIRCEIDGDVTILDDSEVDEAEHGAGGDTGMHGFPAAFYESQALLDNTHSAVPEWIMEESMVTGAPEYMCLEGALPHFWQGGARMPAPDMQPFSGDPLEGEVCMHYGVDLQSYAD